MRVTEVREQHGLMATFHSLRPPSSAWEAGFGALRKGELCKVVHGLAVQTMIAHDITC